MINEVIKYNDNDVIEDIFEIRQKFNLSVYSDASDEEENIATDFLHYNMGFGLKYEYKILSYNTSILGLRSPYGESSCDSDVFIFESVLNDLMAEYTVNYDKIYQMLESDLLDFKNRQDLNSLIDRIKHYLDNTYMNINCDYKYFLGWENNSNELRYYVVIINEVKK